MQMNSASQDQIVDKPGVGRADQTAIDRCIYKFSGLMMY